MKIVRWLIRILAILLALLLPICAAMLMVVENWVGPFEPIMRFEFTDEQRDEICDMLMLDLAPSETLSTCLYPGFGQGKGSLTIQVCGVMSPEDFLSRLQNTMLLDSYQNPSEFEYADLSFSGNTATIFISGEIQSSFPGLTSVMNFLYEDYPEHPYSRQWMKNPMLFGGATLELALIVTLIATSIAKRRKAKEKADAETEGGAT